jgi:hypothetical protein
MKSSISRSAAYQDEIAVRLPKNGSVTKSYCHAPALQRDRAFCAISASGFDPLQSAPTDSFKERQFTRRFIDRSHRRGRLEAATAEERIFRCARTCTKAMVRNTRVVSLKCGEGCHRARQQDSTWNSLVAECIRWILTSLARLPYNMLRGASS